MILQRFINCDFFDLAGRCLSILILTVFSLSAQLSIVKPAHHPEKIFIASDSTAAARSQLCPVFLIGDLGSVTEPVELFHRLFACAAQAMEGQKHFTIYILFGRAQ